MNRKIENKIFLNYLLQSLNLDELKQICRDYKIKGFSKWKKTELVENLLSFLSDEEIESIIKEKETEIVSNSIKDAIKMIKGEGREKLREIRIVNEEEHVVELDFKGFNWETSSYLAINPQNINNPERDCDCRIGSNMGLCSHFWVGFILSLKHNYFALSDCNLTLLPSNFKEMIESIEISTLSTQKGKDQTVTLIDSESDRVEYMKHLDKSITIYEGEISKIDKKVQQFQDIETIYYLVSLTNVRFGPRVKRKSDFKEEDIENLDELYIRLSEKLYEESHLNIGGKITVNGKLTRDDFLRLYILKNIRKITKINPQKD
ncbi:MAG: Rho termination factor N-terminal domain-containing protein [Candidatus Heimdallarchaeota archaeon]